VPAVSRPLRIGLLLPQMEGAMDGATPRWRDLAAMARRAEDAGFDSVWTIDHLIVWERDGDTRRPKGVWECWSLLAALAATTERVTIGSLVSPTTFRNPALLAKMADTVDEISDGRLVVGVGAGSYPHEHTAFGYEYGQRFDRFAEAVAIVRALLRDGRIDFEGEHYSLRDCELRPRRRDGRGPPLLVGTLRHQPRMMNLVAEHADVWNVWMAFGLSTADRVPGMRDAGDAACRAVGRDPATLERSAAVLVDLSQGNIWGTDVPTVLKGRKRVEGLSGTHEQIAEGLRAFADQGMSELQVSLSPNTLAGIEAFAPVLDLLDREPAQVGGVA
jgi:alkanesulfonate monooxygenase SsuD/methylene tetrahydromethanopterin reductase-like flavin-dependent oxidoreductase (luciferase family)